MTSSPQYRTGPPATTSPNGPWTASKGSGGAGQDSSADRRVQLIFSSWSAFVMLLLGGVWVFTEYVNHGGWPSGVTLGAGGSGVWNLWIIYPIVAGVFLMSLHRTIISVRK